MAATTKRGPTRARPIASLPRVLAILALMSAAATTGAASDTRPTPTGAPAGFAERIAARIGDDFVLGDYPVAADTLDQVYRHLAERHSVGGMLARWPRVYGVVVEVTHDGRRGPVYAFAAAPDFTGDVVYAVADALPPTPRAIFVWRKND